jgi:hypothetical protein
MDPATVNESTVEILDPSSVPVPAAVNYNASNRIVFLDPTDPLSTGTTYTVRVKGGDTDPRVKDVAGNPMAADATWTFTTGVAPQVISTTPANGETDVLIGVAPRVRFSKEPSGPLFAAAVLLEDSVGNRVPFDVSFPSSDFTVAILPQGLLQPLQTYTLTLKGGPNEPHITDRNGTPLESDYTWSFTTGAAPPPIPTFSVFAPTVTPANPVSDDSLATEVGMKFRSDGDGFITAVRHYNGGPENVGVHFGKLWASDGTLLGSRSFFFSTAIGWRQRLFQAPIPISANTTYVVSYLAPQGHYANDPGYFASSGVDNGPLHALRDGVDGGNGVFLHSPTGGFPTDTSMSSNYYVDVVFSPRISPPQVLSTTPGPGSILNLPGGGRPATITFTFTEAIDPASVNESTVLLTDTANNPVPFTLSFGAGNFMITLTPQRRLEIGHAYTVTLKGGVGEPHITNATGTPLVADYTWSFTADLLLAPAFTEETMISNRIKAGANFSAMRPEKQPAHILGPSYAPSVLFR